MEVPVPSSAAAPAPIHSPLKDGEVRLVTLVPGEFNDDIECSLSTHLLERDPTYKALSWYWGTPNPDTDPTISLSGQTFSVPVNLERALRHLRFEDKSRVLWIDALCIDQKNTSERSHQVDLMGTIYHTADEVLVWLGEPKEQDGDQRASALVLLWSMMPLDDAGQIPDDLLDESAHTFNEVGWSELIIALKNPWGKRMWVYQEYILAKTVLFMFGHATIRQYSLLEATLRWYQVFDQPQTMLDRVGPVKTALLQYAIMGTDFLSFHNHRLHRRFGASEQRRFEKFNLLELQHLTHPRESSDPRDKIYALRGVAEVGDIIITVDYTRTVEAVYKDFTARCIEDALDMPSWVPDFRASTFRNRWLDEPKTSPDTLTTSSYSLDADGRYLHCDGILYDVLKGVATLDIQDGFKTKPPTSSASSSSLRAPCPPVSYPTGVSRIEDFFRTTMLDKSAGVEGSVGFASSIEPSIFIDNAFGFMYLYGTASLGGSFDDSHDIDPVLQSIERRRQTASYAAAFKSWVDKLFPVTPEVELAREEFSALEESQNTRPKKPAKISWPASYPFHDLHAAKAQAYSLKYVRILAYRTNNRSLCVSAKGYMGLGPLYAQEGDQLCIIFGCSMPMILRPDADGHHQVVGPCFVYGLMQGEAVDEMKRSNGKLQTTTFKLK